MSAGLFEGAWAENCVFVLLAWRDIWWSALAESLLCCKLHFTSLTDAVDESTHQTCLLSYHCGSCPMAENNTAIDSVEAPAAATPAHSPYFLTSIDPLAHQLPVRQAPCRPVVDLQKPTSLIR